MKRRVAPFLAVAIAIAVAPSAVLAADPPRNDGDPAAAQGLFYEARTLMQQKRFTEACPKLEESLRLDPGLGTQFNLADCNEHIGKIATAWAGFLDVAAQAKATNQHEREKVARKRAAALEARVPKLVVDASGAAQGLEVKRDGVVIGAAAWGTAIPVDPGPHKVTASAPGKRTFETTVTTVEGRTARVSVPRDLPAAPPAPAPAPAPVATGAATVDTTHPVASGATTTTLAAPVDPTLSFPPPIVERPGSAQRTLGWVVTAIGAVGVGVGAGFGLSSLAKRDESRDHCVGDACDAIGVDLRDDAIRNGNVATIATIAGGAAIAGGLILVLTAPKGGASHERVGKLRAAPSFGPGGGGFMLQGNFQ